MVPYLVTFSSAFIVAYVAEKEKHIRNTKGLAIFFLLISATILSLLAAFRDDSIGTDVRTYVIRFFDGVVNHSSFKDYLSFNTVEYVEPGYKLLNYIVSRFTDDIKAIHFCIAFFDVSFVLAYLWENRKKMSISLGLLVYMLMQYNVSFNAVRQTMAVCVCLYSFNAARDRRLKKFIVLMAVAFLFHRSSLIMVISYPLVWLLNKKNTQEKDRLIRILVIASVVVLIFINTLVPLFIRVGVFPSKFLHYIGNSFSLSRLSAFVFLIPAVLIFLLYKRTFYRADSFNPLLFLYILIWPIVAQLDSVSDQFGRLAYFFTVANIGFYAQLPFIQRTVRNKTNIRFIRVAIVVFLILYWFISFYVWNSGNTVPYIFC